MRALTVLLALLALTGAARADDGRAVPALGSNLTYRVLTQTTMGARTFGGGMTLTNIVTASDASSAEGVIKPTARIIHCNNGAADPICRDVPGGHIEGDLLTQPIGSKAGDSLAKHSHFKLVYFLPEERTVPIPASRDPKEPFGEVGSEPAFIVTDTLKCDPAALAAFVPIGKAPHAVLACEITIENTASRTGKPPAQATHYTVSYDLTYTGDGWVTLPSGSWPVKKLDFKMIPTDPSHADSGGEGEILFSTQLGALVKKHTIAHDPAAHSMTETTIELISVTP
jgi:hypothetical protein